MLLTNEPTRLDCGVPEAVWNFYIGVYQSAQKWLKGRKDRELSVEDVRHYMKMVVALYESDRTMREIDGVGFENRKMFETTYWQTI